MTKNLLAFAFVLCSFGTQAQYIQNIRFEPQYPGPTDSVLLILDLQFTSGGCEMSSANHIVSNDSIRVDVFHCPGPLAYICDVTDTINLGVLTEGHYSTEIIIHRKIYISPDPCLGSNPVDSSTRELIVYSSTGINEAGSNNIIVKYFSGNRELLVKSSNQKDATIMIFNTVGSLILEKGVGSSERISIPALGQGVYFYKLIDEDGETASGKFLVQ